MLKGYMVRKRLGTPVLAESAKTASREFYLEKRVYIGLTSYGQLRVLRKHFVVQTCQHAVHHQPIA